MVATGGLNLAVCKILSIQFIARNRYLMLLLYQSDSDSIIDITYRFSLTQQFMKNKDCSYCTDCIIKHISFHVRCNTDVACKVYLSINFIITNSVLTVEYVHFTCNLISEHPCTKRYNFCYRSA